MRTPLSTLIIAAFLVNTFGPLPAGAQELYLPKPGVMVHLSPAFNPPVLKGLKVHPDNPFRLDFILDVGDETSFEAKGESALAKEDLKKESTKLIKYFLASLTVPEKDLWVNLSPYEKDRIVPQSFGLTEMGRDLLAQDYLLKQITASLIYPEDEFGKKFWKRVYEEAQKRFGTTNIPVNTFNKVWIVPEKAVVYENPNNQTAYVVESKLKVMLEEDYLALSKNNKDLSASPRDAAQQIGTEVVRQIVIPQLTKEVNQNKNFAQLRQVYNSLILATWYKKKIKDSILNKVYADKNKISGITYTHTPTRPAFGGASPLPSDKPLNAKATQSNAPNDVEGIYQQYLQAFKKGVYNYIKEETDPISQQTIPRKYFSGGWEATDLAQLTLQVVQNIDPIQLGDTYHLSNVSVDLAMFSQEIFRELKTRVESAGFILVREDRPQVIKRILELWQSPIYSVVTGQELTPEEASVRVKIGSKIWYPEVISSSFFKSPSNNDPSRIILFDPDGSINEDLTPASKITSRKGLMEFIKRELKKKGRKLGDVRLYTGKYPFFPAWFSLPTKRESEGIGRILGIDNFWERYVRYIKTSMEERKEIIETMLQQFTDDFFYRVFTQLYGLEGIAADIGTGKNEDHADDPANGLVAGSDYGIARVYQVDRIYGSPEEKGQIALMIRGNAENLVGSSILKKDSLDVVVFQTSLGFIGGPREIPLKSAQKVLRPGGRIIITGENVENELRNVGFQDMEVFTKDTRIVVTAVKKLIEGIVPMPNRPSTAAQSPQDRAMNARKSSEGGIDFKPDKVDSAFAVKNSGGEISAKGGSASGGNFHIDPAMLEQLQNAPGFTPVIIDFQKLKSLPEFLGLNAVAASVGS